MAVGDEAPAEGRQRVVNSGAVRLKRRTRRRRVGVVGEERFKRGAASGARERGGDPAALASLRGAEHRQMTWHHIVVHPCHNIRTR